MSESTSQQRQNWKAYECQSSKMTRIAFGPDSVLVAPPTVEAWGALARVLKANGYEIRTPDTDSYNCREIKGGGGRSLHSFGIALDVNWDTNPYKTTPDHRSVIFSTKATQKERAEDVRLGKADTDLTPAIIADVLAIKTKAGKRVFEWGGNWNSIKDTMHFEIDVTPDDLAAGIDPDSVNGLPAEPIPPPTGVPARPMLQTGSRGEEVKALQQLLMVDGIFGELTEKAVEQFQRARGLDPDGIVGPLTWAELLGPEPHDEDQTWITNIWATTFGGNAETENSAYPPFDRITDTEVSVSLPYAFVGTRPLVQLRNRETGQIVEGAPIRDKGPWNVNDDYFYRGARPQAETGTDKQGRKTNLAGIDLSPGAVRALGYDYDKNWGARIDWRIKPDPKVVAATQKAITPPQPTFAQPKAAANTAGAGNMNDTIWALVRYALISGGTFLAVRYGLLDASQITSVVDQAMPYIGTLISAGTALWGLWVTSRGKRVPIEAAASVNVPTINPVTGGREPGTSYTGR